MVVLVIVQQVLIWFAVRALLKSEGFESKADLIPLALIIASGFIPGLGLLIGVWILAAVHFSDVSFEGIESMIKKIYKL